MTLTSKAQALAAEIFEMGRQNGMAEQSRLDRSALAEVLVDEGWNASSIADLLRKMERAGQ